MVLEKNLKGKIIKPDVSIIISIYNAQEYLERCLRSIVRQSYSNIEIILVDDGSSDSSPYLCDTWAEKDSRIKVIHKDNGGLSSARNCGIQKAIGDYICFVDADDFVDQDLVKKTYLLAQRKNADIVIFSNYEISLTGERIRHNLFSTQNFYKGTEVMKKLFKESIGSLPHRKSDGEVGLAPWDRLYKRELITRNGLKFINERKLIYEDLMFLLDTMPFIKRAAILNEPLYNYCQNPNSLTHGSEKERFKKIKKQFYFLKSTEPYNVEIFNDADTLIRFKRTFLSYIRNYIIQLTLSGASFNNIKEICNDDLCKYILNNYPIHLLPCNKALFAYFLKWKSPFFLIIMIKMKNKRKISVEKK